MTARRINKTILANLFPAIYLVIFLILPYGDHSRQFFRLLFFIFTGLAIYNFKKPLLPFKAGIFPLFSMIIIFGVHFYLLFLNQYGSFQLIETDYTGIAEMMNRTLHGDFFVTSYYSVTREMNFLAHHFSPSTIIFLPFLLLSDERSGYAYGLIFFNLVTFYSFYRLSVKILKDKDQAIILLFLTAGNLYLYRIFTAYHYEAVFPGLVFLLVYFLQDRHLVRAGIVLVLTALLKEDVPVYLMLFFIYYAAFENRKIGIAGSVFSLLIFLLIPVIQRNLDNELLVNWKVLYLSWGNTYPEIIHSFATSPLKVSARIFKSLTLLLDLLLGTAAIWVASYRLLIVILPIVMLHLLSDRMWHNEFHHYYPYTFIPFIMLGLIKGFGLAASRLDARQLMSLVLFLFAIVFYRNSLEADFPVRMQGTRPERVAVVREAALQVPAGSELTVQFDLGAYMDRKIKLYPLRKGFPLKQYILMDSSGFSPYFPVPELVELKDSLVKDQAYGVVFEKDGVVLLKANR